MVPFSDANFALLTHTTSHVSSARRDSGSLSANLRYEGRYYRFENLTIEPQPIQQPAPPIWMGGGPSEKI
jgi:alkanesulfonate monooxygenase SsuD/methylene tetrahydromethanopterin reductase-like flavin-dependent oxidoreductase (luciferase family)